MRVALVHDWLTGMRGGERCLEAFLELYPNADIFTLVHVPGSTTGRIDSRVKKASFLNRVPGISRHYRRLLPLFPLAIASFDLRGYDLVISLSHAAAKNVRVPRGVPHVCYCFTPMRYIWDQARSYLPGPAFYLAQPLLQLLRLWDRRGARRVGHFVAISQFVAARIRRFYGRDAAVIPPPVRMRSGTSQGLTSEERAIFASNPGPFFLCAGALVPYKHIDVAVEAFRRMDLPLWIVGGGPEERKIREMSPPNVKVLGRVSEAFLWECYSRCEALIFPGIEDFGIVPVECLASGRPVIAVDAGGIRESLGCARGSGDSVLVQRNPYGVFIHKRGHGDPGALIEAVALYRAARGEFVASELAARAEAFGYPRFFASWEQFARDAGLAASDRAAANAEAPPVKSQGVGC
jgi:glycosyltransferase involved in cell wall biosynthesis